METNNTGHKPYFTDALVAACNLALDAKIFYEEEFKAFVIEKMGGLGCEGVLVKVVDEIYGEQVHKEASDLIKNSPRGHYLLYRYQSQSDGKDRFKVIISNGYGELGVGGSYDSYDAMPAPEKVVARMLGYEIYKCRHYLEAQRERAADIAALKHFGFQPGYTCKDIRIGSDKFATAKVTATHPESGTVELFLTKRGSPKRWVHTLGAAHLARKLGLLESNERPWIVVIVNSTSQEALFA